MDSDNDISFYVNGIFVGKVEGDAAATPDTDDQLLIGSYTGSQYFNGTIDDIRVYNRALSASAVSEAVGLSPCSEIDLRTRVMLGEDSGTIELDGTCTYTLTSASDSSEGGSGLSILSATTIEGHGATIERSSTADRFRIMKIAPNISPTIRNLTLRNGNVAHYGGGLLTWGNVILENVRFEKNIVTEPCWGGALLAWGKLTADRCFFIDNKADVGCAIAGLTGLTGSITNSVFVDNLSSNFADAIFKYDSAGSMDIVNNTFAHTYKSEHSAIGTNGPMNIKNNIFSNLNLCIEASAQKAVVGADYNLFASVDSKFSVENKGTINSGDNNRIATSLRFVDPDGDNYRLLANSPAIDLGVDNGLTIDADKNTRPYGGGVDIGAYEYQDTMIPAISITKAGPAFVAGGSQTQFVLTVINEGKTTLDDLQVVDILPTGATYVTGSASEGGTLTGGALTWALPVMAPNSKQSVWYSVTADQDLVSENYSVSSVGNSSITDSGPAFTTPYKAAAVALGFSLFPDSYAFENYTDILDSDFTESQMLKFYGPGVCNEGNDSPCVLTTAAESQRQFFANAGSNGHCFGMAMSSLWIYDHEDVLPESYQAGAIHTFDIAKSNARNLIELYHVTQGGDPADQTDLDSNIAAQGGVAVVDKLLENFSDPNAADRYVIGFQNLDGEGGHAVAPYAVNKVDDDTYWIYVYDNNYPNNNDRVFKVTYSTGAWKYQSGAVNPDAPKVDYEGDADHKKYFFLKSLRWAETFPKKCFGGCVDVDTLGAVSVSSAYEFDLTGEGRLMITRDDGLRAGFDPDTGQFIAEIPGAEEIVEMHGPLNIPNKIRIPHEEGYTYSVSIADCPTAFGNKTAPADLNIIGDGVVTRLTGLRIDSAEGLPILGSAASGSNDVVGVTMDGDNHALTFQASDLDSDTPDLSMAVSRKGEPDYSFKVTGAQLSQGRSLSVALDVETGKLSIENDDPAENSYNLEVERLDTDNTRLTYSFASLSDEGSDEGEYVDLGENWTGGAPTVSQGEPVTGDLNADGVLGADDYSLIRSSLGKCDGDEGFIPAADFDDDGCVTYADYRIWYGYYRNR